MDMDEDKRFNLRVEAPESLFQHEDEDEEQTPTRYRAVNRSAVLSVVFGALSLLTILGWYFGALPIVALVLAYRAWGQISRAPGEMTGLTLARTGAILALVLWMAGGGYQLYARKFEVPAGYKVVTFEQLQPDRDKPAEKVSELAKDLDGELVYIKGFIYPTRKIVGLRQFVLVPTEGHCNFCTPQIKPTELMYVRTVGDLTVDYCNHMVGVGGRLRVEPQEGELAGVTYGLEADCFRD